MKADRCRQEIGMAKPPLALKTMTYTGELTGCQDPDLGSVDTLAKVAASRACWGATSMQ